MNFVLSGDLSLNLVNHPLFVKAQELFPSTNLSFNDALTGRSLKDVEAGILSDEDYMIGNMFKKIRDDLGLNPTKRLIDSTLADLSRNAVWDVKLRHILTHINSAPALGPILLKARDICHELFSDFDPWALEPRHTFGATEYSERSNDLISRLRSANSSSLDALDDLPSGHALKALYLYKAAAVDKDREDRQSSGGTQDGSYVLWSSVGKTAVIDRPIGYHEPLQLSVQNGIGDYHFTALKKVGIDMSSAQSTHREIAEIYSMYPGIYCTMDQSNASQNILRTLVEFLYPSELFSLMNAVAPKRIVIEGESYPLLMMSAQGNGFNTGMQTAVYYSLISAVAWYRGIKTRVYQYGDDSIFAAELFEPVSKVFAAIGFQVNLEKSFLSHVLESCGMDARDGHNIRPFYVKTLPRTPREWYHVCNGIYRVGYVNNNNTWRSSSFKHLWLWCISNIPTSRRFFGPAQYGDNVLIHHNSGKYSYDRTGSRIRAFGETLDSGKRFTQVTNGLPAGNVFALLPHASLRGSGLRHSNKYGWYFPSVLGNRDTVYVERWLPYPPSTVDETSIDTIFSSLNLKAEVLQHQYDARLHAHRYKLIQALKRYASKRSILETEVNLDILI